jgi:hypothetical protein
MPAYAGSREPAAWRSELVERLRQKPRRETPAGAPAGAQRSRGIRKFIHEIQELCPENREVTPLTRDRPTRCTAGVKPSNSQ